MRYAPVRFTLAAAGLCLSAAASAQWRCDCATIVDGCTAEVSVEDTFVEVSTPTAQCARVDYLIDGMPFVSVAVEGSAREDWISPGADPRVVVQSCQVCADRSLTQAPQQPAAETAAGEPAPLTPLVAPQPVYPALARDRGVEGTVTVAFVVNPYGDTANAEVVSAEPAGVFDLAAVSAISRWRYPADGEREPVSLTETLRFSLDTARTGGTSPSARMAADAGTRPGNQCVRETVTYNYGEMIEVGLISACAQPMSVFACAVGTGAQAQRWVCTSTERNGTILVRPGDPRRGQSVETTTATGQRRFEFAENFFVARAPNSEYWWMACASDDEQCLGLARQWSGSLDRQAAHIDPQVLTRAAVARSY